MCAGAIHACPHRAGGLWGRRSQDRRLRQCGESVCRAQAEPPHRGRRRHAGGAMRRAADGFLSGTQGGEQRNEIHPHQHPRSDAGVMRRRQSASGATWFPPRKTASAKKTAVSARRAADILSRAKIGAGAPLNTVFVKRRPTGEIYTPELAAGFPGRDWMLTRMLWLSGCEPGFNRLGEVDTMRRYIYIHGSPDSAVMGRAGFDWLHPHAQPRPRSNCSISSNPERRSRYSESASADVDDALGCASQRNWVECGRTSSRHNRRMPTDEAEGQGCDHHRLRAGNRPGHRSASSPRKAPESWSVTSTEKRSTKSSRKSIAARRRRRSDSPST